MDEALKLKNGSNFMCEKDIFLQIRSLYNYVVRIFVIYIYNVTSYVYMCMYVI